MPTEPISVETAIEENVSVFEGHPAEETGEQESGEKVEKSDEKLAKPEEEIEKPEEEVAKPEEEVAKPAFEYVSQEAAEKGVKDAKTRMHEKAEEAKREREKADALQKQLNELLIKPEPPKPTSADRMGDLLEQVNALDPDDEDYNSQVAAIWGRREDEIQSNIDAKVKEALDSYDKKTKEATSKAEEELSSQRKIVEDAEAAGTASGLDMKKGSNDSEMFWVFADKAPEGSIEDQIKWTVGKVKGLKAAIVAPFTGDKAKTAQEQNSVLERGGTKPTEKVVPDTPLGLATAFEKLQRRI